MGELSLGRPNAARHHLIEVALNRVLLIIVFYFYFGTLITYHVVEGGR